jgi:hypothetical protein
MLCVLNNSRYFDNFAKTLAKILNVPLTSEIKYNTDKTYIIFNMRDIKSMPRNYIIYNFEQLDTKDNFDKYFWPKFYNAKQIFDYSLTNIEVLSKLNYNATFVPYGWNVLMKNKIIQPFNKRINNILFLGHLNERRINILRPVHTLCKANDYTIFINNDCWGNEYNNMLNITKIALNIHCYSGNTILEVHRIIPYILNKIWVISERSQDSYYDNLLNNMVTWTDNNFDKEIEKVLSLSSIEVEKILSDRQRLLIESCLYTFDKKLINV